MNTPTSRLRRGAIHSLSFLLWSVLFGVAYTQPPLYYSNQNQYFLHGLAHAGYGFLNEDWLANTADPTPCFSGLVAFTGRYLPVASFYAYYILILGIYFHALVGICAYASGSTALLGFRTGLLVLHSGLLRWLSARWLGVDYPWYFQAGVANQYLLGAGLQPSVFGVFLLLSVATYLRGRLFGAATWAALAAIVHSTYLLAAALLTLAYLVPLVRERRFTLAFGVGLWTLFLVSPVVIYNLVTFAPTTPETFAESQHLLAHFRIPHHAQIERWLDGIALGQIAWIVLAMVLVRGNRLFVIMAVTFGLSCILTLAQWISGNDTLALLFPWRASALLVPLATAVVLTRTIRVPPRWALGAILCAFVGGGAVISYFDLGYRVNQQEIALLNHVSQSKQQGENYLLPVEVPKLASAKRGAASLNFTPPPRRASQSRVISVDLQRFRLFTGTPIYVDFKSIPYLDVEVLEWERRVEWNQQFYQWRAWTVEDVKSELIPRGITHVVAPADREVNCDALELVYADDTYRLYRIKR